MSQKRNQRSILGFTIVELTVVMVVLGILASLVVFSIGSWRTRVATDEVKNDLTAVKTAMESVRNFSNGYPTSIPTTFDASPAVTVTYMYGNTTEYCVEAVSIKVPTVEYFLDSMGGNESPAPGNCP